MKTIQRYLFMLCVWLSCITAYAQSVTDLITQLNNASTNAEQILITKRIGAYYQQQKAFAKAQEYFEKALQKEIKEKVTGETLVKTRGNIAYCQVQQKKYKEAIQQYEAMLGHAKQHKLRNKELNLLEKLAYLQTLRKNYEASLEYTQQVLTLHQTTKNPEGIVQAYNNLGYLYQVKGENKKSLESYRQAVTLSAKYVKSSSNDLEKATLYTNMGGAYSHLRDFKTAHQYFNDALKIYKRTDQRDQQAKAYNFQAANFYISGKGDAAINRALKAVELAKATDSKNHLLESYQILSAAYQQQQNFKDSQYYLKLYQALKTKIDQEEQQQQQALLQKQINVEKKENELKQLLAEKERQASALKQSQLEKEKQQQALKLKEQELSLLKRNQELQLAKLREQKLEKDRVQQLLQLSEQKALAEKRKREVERQALLTEKERIEKEKEKAEKEKQEQARNSLEKQTALQKKQLEQEKVVKRYGIFILALAILLMVFVFIAFIGSQRARKKLKTQYNEIESQKVEIESQHKELLEKNDEIETQNEELHQSQEEIMSQRDFIESRNKELEHKNKQISSSIKVAYTIQQAILPYQKKMDALLHEYFVIYRPKDVVSGDFYWINKVENKTVLVVADCTGHGVPGAFMTLIGKTLLDKIILLRKITSPAEILDKLHDEIQVALRQNETQNNSGMDVVVLVIEVVDEQHKKVTFAGAKNPLYYNTPEHKIMRLKGDRKGIGGLQNPEQSFNNQELVLPKNTMLYTGSDGFQDQNNRKRRVFGSKRFNEMLEMHCQKPLDKQQELIEATLDKHQEGTTQRDDILMVGLKL